MATKTDLRRMEARFASEAGLRRALRAELSSGGYLVRGERGAVLRERCELELVHPASGERLVLEAEVVWIGDDGAGLQLTGFDGDLLERLRTFARATPRTSTAPAAPATAPAARATAPAARASGPASGALEGANPFLKLRGLPLAQQLRRARTGEMQERVALERLYGKAVWEVLLSNPRISAVEVARIARKGQLPQPLVDLIAANDGWLASPEVRRSLLTNPRLRGRALRSVLSALPKSELALVEQQTAYPAHVRIEARRLQGRR